MRLPEICVLKFGGSVLASRESLSTAVHEIYRCMRAGRRVVAVVSALNGTTDELLNAARGFADELDPGALAALLSTGEAQAAAWLGLALDRAGIPMSVLDPAAIKLEVEGPILDADPVGLDVPVILRALEERPVVVVPGFTGRTRDGRIALLGRGGTDLTALFIASALRARCRLIKDVDGVYESDPSESFARRYTQISWDDALALGGQVVQDKALSFAKSHRLAFDVGSAGAVVHTRVGPDPSAFARPRRPDLPLRIGLCGLGTVGSGVWREISRHPEAFQVVGVLVKNLRKHDGSDVPPDLLTDDARQILDRRCDVLVELVGGIDPARSWIRTAFDRGCDVVTANKALMAAHGVDLTRRAVLRGRRLFYSASVGGSLPLVESVGRAAETGRVLSFEGVLNGTTNFILDSMHDGMNLEAAIVLAQERGFAEADPSADLEGKDAAAKLVILARQAFGRSVRVRWEGRSGIDRMDPDEVCRAEERGEKLRLVASCRRTRKGCVARVRLESMSVGHPLAQVRGAENRLMVFLEDGRTLSYSGKGAGCWPTTESVMGDLLALHRIRGRAEDRFAAAS